MNAHQHSTPEPAEPDTDPVTIIALVYRILDRPHRTAGLVAILSLLLGGAAVLAHAPLLAGLSPGVWGIVISGASTVVAMFRTGWRKWLLLRQWITRKTQGMTVGAEKTPVE